MGRRSNALAAPLLILATCAGSCSKGKDRSTLSGDTDVGMQLLTDQERDWLSPSLPTAAKKQTLTIPDTLLPEEDVTYENNTILALFDADDTLIGYARNIFTRVECNGACQAVRFMLVYDASSGFLDVFHPGGTTYDLMKYWQGEHTPFTADDRALLKTLLASPPSELAAVTDPSTLVADSSATAPTVPAYQDFVVRGAAFTTYTTLMYRLDTVDLIAAITAP